MLTDGLRPGRARAPRSSPTPPASRSTSWPLGRAAGRSLVGTHFMNPPYLIRMVEVIRGPRTGEPTMDAVHRAAAALGRGAGRGPGRPRLRHQPAAAPDDQRRGPGRATTGTAAAEAVDALMRGLPRASDRPAAHRRPDRPGQPRRLAHACSTSAPATTGCRPCELLLDKVRDGPPRPQVRPGLLRLRERRVMTCHPTEHGHGRGRLDDEGPDGLPRGERPRRRWRPDQDLFASGAGVVDVRDGAGRAPGADLRRRHRRHRT